MAWFYSVRRTIRCLLLQSTIVRFYACHVAGLSVYDVTCLWMRIQEQPQSAWENDFSNHYLKWRGFKIDLGVYCILKFYSSSTILLFFCFLLPVENKRKIQGNVRAVNVMIIRYCKNKNVLIQCFAKLLYLHNSKVLLIFSCKSCCKTECRRERPALSGCFVL